MGSLELCLISHTHGEIFCQESSILNCHFPNLVQIDALMFFGAARQCVWLFAYSSILSRELIFGKWSEVCFIDKTIMRKYNLIVIQIHSTQKNVILASTIKLRINEMEMVLKCGSGASMDVYHIMQLRIFR